MMVSIDLGCNRHNALLIHHVACHNFGAATASALADAGARVVLTGQRAVPLEAVASQIRQVDFAVTGDARADHR